MNGRKIDANIYAKLNALAVASGVGSVRGMLLKLIADYEARNPQDAQAANDYLDLANLVHDEPITYKGGLSDEREKQ